jgi:DNA polymerase-3 subunit delta
MRIGAEQLDAQLGRGLAPIYAVWGDELLALEAADAIRAAARRNGFDEREVLVALGGFDWQQVTAAGANLSLFGSRKLIDLRIPSGKPGTEGARVLKEYAEHASPDNLLLVSLPDLGWQDEKAVWLNALADAGVGIKAIAPPLASLPQWIAQRLARQNQRADQDTLRFLADRVQGNLLAARQEIIKLGMLLPEGNLDAQAIRDAVVDVARFDLDDLRGALLAGSLQDFARTLDGLRQEGEALPLVLWAVSEELRALLQVARGLARGVPIDALLREARVFGPRQAAIRRAAPRFGAEPLDKAMRELAGIDRMIKGVATGDPWDALLAMMIALHRATRRETAG